MAKMNRKISVALPWILLCCFAAALLASCDFLWDVVDQPLVENEFYARNTKTLKYYKLKADKRAEGDYCVVWVERGGHSSVITDAQAKAVADEYDTVIRSRILGAFGKQNVTARDPNTQKGISFPDILKYANWLANRNDGKLTILLLDIQDGFKNPQTDSYVAGYFHGLNFLEEGPVNIGQSVHYSNARDMIYIDTYPAMGLGQVQEIPKQVYATFAHELQHLINFVTTFNLDGRGVEPEEFEFMDTWIDEGLSSQAEHIYLGEYLSSRVRDFSEDRYGTIAKGNNFFVWGNHEDIANSILDDYATVYLFFRWLYLQAGSTFQTSIFREIETSKYYDHRIITDIAKKINPAWSNWETLLRTWFAANYAPGNATYGYKGDADLQKEIKVKNYPGTSTSARLYPGEGVYSTINGSFTPTLTGTRSNIKYAGLTSSQINTTPAYTGSVLLTFNVNTANDIEYDPLAVEEIGSLTGVAPPAASTRAVTDNVQSTERTGPFIIDARDLFGRDKEPVYKLPIR
jgi:hypothetical protein